MNYWIVPCNLNMFNPEGALQANHGLVDWRVSCNMMIGDVVFLYISKPEHRIRYRMEVVEVDLDENRRFDQEKFWVNKKAYRKGLERNHARFKLVHEYKDPRLSFALMREHGFVGNLQGPQRCPKELIECFLKER